MRFFHLWFFLPKEKDCSDSQSWACCTEERKSASIFFVAPQRKIGCSQAQLRSLRFKLLDATLNHNFYNWSWYGGILLEALIA
jgi:hypothetical protein